MRRVRWDIDETPGLHDRTCVFSWQYVGYRAVTVGIYSILVGIYGIPVGIYSILAGIYSILRRNNNNIKLRLILVAVPLGCATPALYLV